MECDVWHIIYVQWNGLNSEGIEGRFFQPGKGHSNAKQMTNKMI